MNEKKKISLPGRLCAFSVALVFCIALSSTFLIFPFSTRADSLPETVVSAVRAYDTFLHDLFTKSPVWYSSAGAQVAFAQLAVLSPYTEGGVFTPSDGYSYYYSGVSYDSSGHPYVGSGWIGLTSEARSSVRLYSEDLSSSIFIYNYATDPDNSPWIVSAGSHGMAPGYMWYGAPMSGFYEGEPFTYLAIGEDTSNPTGNTFALANATYCYCHFYSPSAIDAYVKSAIETPHDDAYSAIVDVQYDLHEDFPDADPDLFLDPQTLLVLPETSNSEDTTVSGNDDIFTLPSEWLESYTQPIPTFDTISFSDVPYPTFDISTNSNGLGFWFVFAKKILESDSSGRLKNFFYIVFGLAVCGVVIWKLGSHGGDD